MARLASPHYFFYDYTPGLMTVLRNPKPKAYDLELELGS